MRLGLALLGIVAGTVLLRTAISGRGLARTVVRIPAPDVRVGEGPLA